jgi:hypothetical protein
MKIRAYKNSSAYNDRVGKGRHSPCAWAALTRPFSSSPPRIEVFTFSSTEGTALDAVVRCELPVAMGVHNVIARGFPAINGVT